MSIAWYIEAIRSAFASALYGGLLMARSTLYLVQKRGYFENKHHSEIWFDELLSYIVRLTHTMFRMLVLLSSFV